jgi:hypothetical protein
MEVANCRVLGLSKRLPLMFVPRVRRAARFQNFRSRARNTLTQKENNAAFFFLLTAKHGDNNPIKTQGARLSEQTRTEE